MNALIKLNKWSINVPYRSISITNITVCHYLQFKITIKTWAMAYEAETLTSAQ